MFWINLSVCLWQGQLQSTGSEIVSAKKQAQARHLAIHPDVSELSLRMFGGKSGIAR